MMTSPDTEPTKCPECDGKGEVFVYSEVAGDHVSRSCIFCDGRSEQDLREDELDWRGHHDVGPSREELQCDE